MKTFKPLTLAVLLAIAMVAALAGCAANDSNATPYPLATCAVCGMKLADMKSYDTFVYQGREIKVCDKGEEAEFKKDPAKYLKDMDAAEAKAKAGATTAK